MTSPVGAGIGAAVRRALLSEVERAWRGRPAAARPWGVWAREHGPIHVGVDESMAVVRAPLVAAWFLDEGGWRRRDPWMFARFWAVHVVRPWDWQVWSPVPNAVFGRVHEIALAAFAPYAGTESFYLRRPGAGATGPATASA